MALGVALAADIAGPRRSASICGRLIVSCRSSRLGSFARASPLRGRPRLAPLRLRCLRLRRRLLPRIERRIPRDVLDKMAILPRRVSCRRLARRLSANSEKVRENVASLGSRPAPLQPHSRHSLPSTQDARSGRARRNVEHRLGYEGARQRRAVLLRTPYLAAEVGQKSLNPHQFQNRDEELVALAHRAKLALKPRDNNLVERRTSNPIASRAGTRLHSSVVDHAVFCDAHDTHEGGPVPPRLHSKNRCLSVLQEAPL